MLRQMSLRKLLVLALLLAAMGAERFAYYGIRSFVTLELTRVDVAWPVRG